MSFLKKYWAEIITFGTIFGVLMLCNLPAMTWINTDSDGAHYILSAKYMGVAHNTSAPLFLLLGKLFLYLPFGTDAWRMGFISVLSTSICAVLIYFVVMEYLRWNKNGRYYALIASLIYGGSALVISQSTIIETYALSTCLSVGAYLACIKRKWVIASLLFGAIGAIHPLFFVMTWAVLVVVYKELRKVKYLSISASFLLFYAYIPLTRIYGGVPEMWGNSSLTGFFQNNFGTMWMLVGGLSLGDIPKRIIDTVLMLTVSMGLGLVILVWYFIKNRTMRDKLKWLVLIPIVYFIINLSSETYVYMIPSIAFGAIIVGIYLPKLNYRWALATAGVSIALMGFNANYLDIGRTLDPDLSAQRFYDEELPKIADGEIYLGGGWTWAIVYLYNKEENRNIIPVCTDILPSEEYLQMVEAKGVKLIRTDSKNNINQQWEVALSIAQLNDNVWIAKDVKPREYQYQIVPAKDNLDLITRWLGVEVQPELRWQPSNPYDFMTGALEVEEWKFILKSNHNARLAIIWGIYGYGAVVLIRRLITRKKRVLA